MRLGALVLVMACNGGGGGTCDGGGDPFLEVGTGSRDAFAPLQDGDTLEGSGSAIEFSLVTTGLDTTQPITTVVRISADGGATTDSVAQLTYQCSQDVGTGWQSVTASLPSEASDGSALAITVSTTDALRTNAAQELSGTLSL